MACYKPLVAQRRIAGGVVVTRGLKDNPLDPGEFVVPCGQCIGCRIRRSQHWAIRCLHENNMQEERGLRSSFLTLTYDERNLPPDGSLSKEDHVAFIGHLRKKLWRNHRRKIRYYMCGEYGEKLSRPHFHYLIFGHGFEDKYHWKTHKGVKYYRSPELEEVWRYGNSLIGHVTVESAAYCARYVMKKQTGRRAVKHYVNEDGVVIEPEFNRMSLKPGIGESWFRKYGESDIYDSGDFIVISGKKYSTPRYYDSLLGKLDERKLEDIKDVRRSRAAEHASDQTIERRKTREEVQQRKLTKLKRGYESD